MRRGRSSTTSPTSTGSPLAIALGLQLAPAVRADPAWRNIVRASYPDLKVPRRTIAGAYLVGRRRQRHHPGPGGDVLKLYLVTTASEDTTYPTLGATLIVETLLDMVVAGAILVWALTIGVLPGLDVLPHLPQVDWSWPLRHKREALIVAGVWIAVLALLRGDRHPPGAGIQGAGPAGLRDLRHRWRIRHEGGDLAGCCPGASASLRLLLPEGVHGAGDAAQRAARPGRAEPLDAVSVHARRGRHAAGAAGLRLRPGRNGIAGALLLSFSVGMYIAVDDREHRRRLRLPSS